MWKFKITSRCIWLYWKNPKINCWRYPPLSLYPASPWVDIENEWKSINHGEVEESPHHKHCVRSFLTQALSRHLLDAVQMLREREQGRIWTWLSLHHIPHFISEMCQWVHGCLRNTSLVVVNLEGDRTQNWTRGSDRSPATELCLLHMLGVSKTVWRVLFKKQRRKRRCLCVI